MKKITSPAFVFALALALTARAADAKKPAVPMVSGVDPALLAEFAEKEPAAYTHALKDAHPRGCVGAPDSAQCWRIVISVYERSSRRKVNPAAVNRAMAPAQEAVENSRGTDTRNPETAKRNAAIAPIEGRQTGAGNAVPATAQNQKGGGAANPNDTIPDNPKAGQGNAAVVPPPGDLKASPAKADDPNKWNNGIAAAKGGIYGGLLGFIFFGGPVGMLLFALIGFTATYLIKKMTK